MIKRINNNKLETGAYRRPTSSDIESTGNDIHQQNGK